jgi:hypothetical protein
MKEQIEQVKEKLQKQLSKHQEERPPLRRLKLCKEATREAIVELALLTPTNGLTDPEEILLYHTQWAPYFYGKLYFFNKCFDQPELMKVFDQARGDIRQLVEEVRRKVMEGMS